MPTTFSSAPFLHLSLVTGTLLSDAEGRKCGRVVDLTVLLADRRAPISGAIVRLGHREVFAPASELAGLGYGGLRLDRADASKLTEFAPRTREVRLCREVLDHTLIDLRTRRLVRVNEVELMPIDGWYEVVGVDGSLRAFLRRLLPRRLAPAIPARGFRDWTDLEPLTNDLAERAGSRLRRLHPVELADLVETAAHGDGEEIIAATRADPELEAALFEELNRPHRLEFLHRRSDYEVAHVLARMEPDTAADVLQTLPQQRQVAILALLSPLLRREILDLLSYKPKTAGGLMTPQFACLDAGATKADALHRLERSHLPAHVLNTIFIANHRRRLTGAIPLPELLRADPAQPLREIAQPALVRVKADAELEELARLMSDYNLAILPVVDDQERLIGVVTIDDVLTLVLPTHWRRRFDILAGD